MNINLDTTRLNHLYNYVSGNPITWSDLFGLAGSNHGSGGSSGKGTTNPYKHCRVDPKDPSYIICDQKGTGKKIRKKKPADFPEEKCPTPKPKTVTDAEFKQALDQALINTLFGAGVSTLIYSELVGSR